MMGKAGAELHPLAVELNSVIERENRHVWAMLSELGRRMYFPKGILQQSAEAKQKAKRFDATIGIARENGKPMFLPSIMGLLPALSPAEALSYAPATGQPELRRKWRELLLAKNPSLQGKSFSLPVVTNGVTHALSLVGDLLVDEGDVVLLPDKFWENYELLFAARCQGQLLLYPLFSAAGGFNVEGLRQALATRVGSRKTVVVLNFPNNPTGYSVTRQDAEAIVAALVEAADNGCNLVVVMDDAYFGLFYDEEALPESLFARVAGAHERILAIKVDGPTKEQFVWGFRMGMLTFSAHAEASADELYRALEQKAAGAIRSAISNCSQPAQSVLLKALNSEAIAAEQRQKRAVLQSRAEEARRVLSSPEFADVWETYPFNAGYFMCLRLKHVGAEAYRKHLLDRYGIGVIADGDHDIRVAFSAVELSDLPELYSTMAAAARELSG
ncbi:MAG: aminotransferase class I/II-fold pyridoxal phosphate-dependent enzyme [Armatimonadota bacterium]